MHSSLDAIAGLGPKTKRALLQHFGSVDNLVGAGDSEILGVSGVNRGHLRALRQVITAPSSESSGEHEHASGGSAATGVGDAN